MGETVSRRRIPKRRVNKKRIRPPVNKRRIGEIPSGNIPYCWNSRRWLLMGIDPRSCPYLGYQGNVNCMEESCGYFEWREPTPYIRWKMRELEIREEAWDG